MRQATALEILKSGANVFLTGEPGSGKTHTINQYIQWLREHGVYPAVTASTGIASTHINGSTIHSWAGIGIHRELTDSQIENIMDKPWVYNKILNTKVLIIDEISMLDAVTLDDVERVVSRIKAQFMSNEPFSGIQVIFVGDFFQLPPVTSELDKKPAKFAFESRAWEDAKPVYCYLDEQHRQEDDEFLAILTKMRQGILDKSHIERLHQTKNTVKEGELVTKLYTHNAAVDSINTNELAKLQTEKRIYGMEAWGNPYLISVLKKNCLSPEILKLKIGALVMFTRNNFDEDYVNGTLGTVVAYSSDGFPIVETTEGKKITARYAEWSIQEGNVKAASVSQIPLRLAWAITVHKSQGMSLDRAVIDLSKAFEYGQGYVALSRVRSLAGLSLEGLNEKALEMHPVIVEKDNWFKYKSSELNEQYINAPAEVKEMQAQEFLQKLIK